MLGIQVGESSSFGDTALPLPADSSSLEDLGPVLRRSARLQHCENNLKELSFPKGCLQQPIAVPQDHKSDHHRAEDKAMTLSTWQHVSVSVAGESGNKKTEIPTPLTWQEALAGPYASEWMEAMTKEFKGLETTGTFAAIPRPQGVNIVKCKWVFRIKRTETGAPIFKARLVAKGFYQKQEVDCHHIWAPTARQVTARVILHLAATIKHMPWM